MSSSRHDEQMLNRWFWGVLCAIAFGGFPLILVWVAYTAPQDSVTLTDDERIRLRKGLEERVRLESYNLEILQLCQNLEQQAWVDLSVCGQVDTGLHQTRNSWGQEQFNGLLTQHLVAGIPKFRYACEADASCLCAAMDGDLPEWWDLDDPSRSYIYECRQGYVDGEWVPINDN